MLPLHAFLLQLQRTSNRFEVIICSSKGSDIRRLCSCLRGLMIGARGTPGLTEFGVLRIAPRLDEPEAFS
jgi:hypothetical protein